MQPEFCIYFSPIDVYSGLSSHPFHLTVFHSVSSNLLDTSIWYPIRNVPCRTNHHWFSEMFFRFSPILWKVHRYIQTDLPIAVSIIFANRNDSPPRQLSPPVHITFQTWNHIYKHFHKYYCRECFDNTILYRQKFPLLALLLPIAYKTGVTTNIPNANNLSFRFNLISFYILYSNAFTIRPQASPSP